MTELFTERDHLKSSSGFTLLELLISFAIISVIVLIVAGSMRLAHHSVESGERMAEYLERMRGAIGIISSQIQSQVPLTYMDDAEKRFYFQGDRESMQLATNYSIWGRERGFTVVGYRVESGPDGKKIMFASEHTIGLEDSRETRLFTGADTLHFEYFYKGPTDEEGSWTDKWTAEDAIPEKIRLNLVTGRKDFSMIIPMRTVPQAPPQQPATTQPTIRPQFPGTRPR